MNEELDSQLSAMFDDELPPQECELLARRLSRDEALKARWGRYAVVGAVIRAERGVRLNAPLAGRVNAAIDALPEDLRTAIVLRELEGLSYEEIATAMDCPVGTVRSRIFRAREAIDKRLREVFEGGLGRAEELG